MTENEVILKVKSTRARSAWINMMRERKEMRENGVETEVIAQIPNEKYLENDNG